MLIGLVSEREKKGWMKLEAETMTDLAEVWSEAGIC